MPIDWQILQMGFHPAERRTGLVSGVDAVVPVTAAIAFEQGANIIRTHDVRETVQALCICAAARAVDQPVLD